MRPTIFAAGFLTIGFCLAQSFNMATNPQTNKGFVEGMKFAKEKPIVLALAATTKVDKVVFPLVIASGAAMILAFMPAPRKKDDPAPK